VARNQSLEGRICTYNPIGWDRWDPKMISGRPIVSGSKVTVTKDNVDPRGLFIWIKNNGDEQSVFKKSVDCS